MELENKKVDTEVKNEKGATMVEYAMMVALIAAVCVVAIRNIGQAGNAAFNTVGVQMNSAVAN